MTILEHGPEAPEGVYPGQLVDYDSYRGFCDMENGFHHVGILSEEAYDAAVRDERTVFTEIGGRLLPALVSLEFEDGYDHERVKRLSERAFPMLAALPVSHMTKDTAPVFVGQAQLDKDAAIVIEQPGLELDETVRSQVKEYFSRLGTLSVGDFIDKRVKHIDGHAAAWLSFYSFSFSANEIARETPPAADFDEAWQQYCAEKDMEPIPGPDATGTYLLTPDYIKQHPEILDELWDISKAGFGDKLGKYHPVSMEETKQFFAEHMISEETYTAIHFENGKPSCFGSMVFDIESCEWLNLASSSMQKELATAAEENEKPLWFSEIISRGLGQSHNIFQLFLDLAGRTHRDYRVLYESSNFASTHIPDMAMDQVSKAVRLALKRPNERLDKMNYWYLRHNESV